MWTEKRAYKRFAFPKDRPVKATLAQAGKNTVLEALVLNISCSGIGLAAEKAHNNGRIAVNDKFVFQDFTPDRGLGCLKGQEVKVAWVLDSDQFANFGVGCEFVDVDEARVEKLKALLEDGGMIEG